jgi:hypothetical protein
LWGFWFFGCFGFWFFGCFGFLVGLGFELRALCLQNRHHTSVHFALFILEMGVLKLISPGYPQTMILEISASQVPRITDESHHCPVNNTFF